MSNAVVEADKRPAMRDGIIRRGQTWSYVVREVDPKDGKRKPRWVGGFATRTAAKQARDRARSDVTRGTYVSPATLTVAEWLDQWLTGHSVELKPTTVLSYKAKIDSYLVPNLGHERLQALSPSRLSVLFRELGESGGQNGAPLSPRTVEYCRAILRKACADAVVERILETNPVIGSKAPRKQGKPKHTTWTAAQQAAFLAAQEHQGSRWAALWALALATGVRRGELVGLRWENVDLAAGVVNVETATAQLGTELVEQTPKNHERRTIALDRRTVERLRAWRREQAAERLAWGPAYEHAGDWVFTWENGRRVLPDYLSKAFLTCQEGMGLPRMTLHGCRHSHATVLLRAGVPVHVVAKRLGHKDPSVTLNVYADCLPQDDTDAAAVYEQELSG